MNKYSLFTCTDYNRDREWSENFEDVVIDFLYDRQIDREYVNLDMLMKLRDKDSYDQDLEFLRASFLIQYKFYAVNWLKMYLRKLSPERLAFDSKLDWHKKPLTLKFFKHNAYNIFNDEIPFWQLVYNFIFYGGSGCENTDGVLDYVVKQNLKYKPHPNDVCTIWIPMKDKSGSFQCAEGNYRMHSFVYWAIKGICEHKLKAWFGEKRNFKKEKKNHDKQFQDYLKSEEL